MSEEFAPPVRFPRLLAKVNAFLLVAALLVLTFGGIVAHKQGWFVHQTMIRVITPDALGISKGMPVKLFGFTIGSVQEMQLVAGGVDVQLGIMSEHMQRIPKGSRARFARESGVIGASVIEIIPGKPIAGELHEGEQIEFDRSESAMRDASEVFSAAKRVWPLSDAFKDAPDATLPIDSFEAQGAPRSRRQ